MEKLTRLLRVSVSAVVWLTLFVLSCRPPDIGTVLPTKEIEKFVVYDVEGLTGNKLEQSALEKIPHVTLEKDIVQKIFTDVKYHRGWKVVWKGSWLGIASMQDGTERRMAISYYGGYFKVFDHPGYYQVVGGSQEVLDREFQRILDVFVPMRLRSQNSDQ